MIIHDDYCSDYHFDYQLARGVPHMFTAFVCPQSVFFRQVFWDPKAFFISLAASALLRSDVTSS